MAQKKKTKSIKAPNPLTPIEIQLEDMDLEEFRSNEDIEDPDALIKANALTYSLEFLIKIDVEQLRVAVYITYSMSDTSKTEMMFVKSINKFIIKDLTKHITQGENKLSFTNQKIPRFLAEKSLSHTRGMHALRIKTTKWATFLIPLTDFGELSGFNTPEKNKLL